MPLLIDRYGAAVRLDPAPRNTPARLDALRALNALFLAEIGLTVKEIASVMRCGQSTAHLYLARARAMAPAPREATPCA